MLPASKRVLIFESLGAIDCTRGRVASQCAPAAAGPSFPFVEELLAGPRRS